MKQKKQKKSGRLGILIFLVMIIASYFSGLEEVFLLLITFPCFIILLIFYASLGELSKLVFGLLSGYKLIRMVIFKKDYVRVGEHLVFQGKSKETIAFYLVPDFEYSDKMPWFMLLTAPLILFLTILISSIWFLINIFGLNIYLTIFLTSSIVTNLLLFYTYNKSNIPLIKALKGSNLGKRAIYCLQKLYECEINKIPHYQRNPLYYDFNIKDAYEIEYVQPLVLLRYYYLLDCQQYEIAQSFIKELYSNRNAFNPQNITTLRILYFINLGLYENDDQAALEIYKMLSQETKNEISSKSKEDYRTANLLYNAITLHNKELFEEDMQSATVLFDNDPIHKDNKNSRYTLELLKKKFYGDFIVNSNA